MSSVQVVISAADAAIDTNANHSTKNAGGGVTVGDASGKNRGGKRNRRIKKVRVSNRQIPLRSGEDQHYAVVVKLLGGTHYTVRTCDGDKEFRARKCGRLKYRSHKRIIAIDDTVLIAIRDFEKGDVDVIEAYNYDETRELIRMKQISRDISTMNHDSDDEETGFDFDDI